MCFVQQCSLHFDAESWALPSRCLPACAQQERAELQQESRHFSYFGFEGSRGPLRWMHEVGGGGGGQWQRGFVRHALLQSCFKYNQTSPAPCMAASHALHPNPVPCYNALLYCLYLQAKDFHRNLGELQDQLVAQHSFHMAAEEVSRRAWATIMWLWVPLSSLKPETGVRVVSILDCAAGGALLAAFPTSHQSVP